MGFSCPATQMTSGKVAPTPCSLLCPTPLTQSPRPHVPFLSWEAERPSSNSCSRCAPHPAQPLTSGGRGSEIFTWPLHKGLCTTRHSGFQTCAADSNELHAEAQPQKWHHAKWRVGANPTYLCILESSPPAAPQKGISLSGAKAFLNNLF